MPSPEALDEQVGQVVATLPDGTVYRQVLLNPAEGETHVTPDGQKWVAVREGVVDGKVVQSPFTIHWKAAVLAVNTLIQQLKSDPGTQRRVLNQLQLMARDLGWEANLLPSIDALASHLGAQGSDAANFVIIYGSDSKKNSASIVLF